MLTPVFPRPSQERVVCVKEVTETVLRGVALYVSLQKPTKLFLGLGAGQGAEGGEKTTLPFE